MSACDHCRHNSDCFEQRGRCADFETPKQYRKRLRQDIEIINETTEKVSAVRPVPADIARQGESNRNDGIRQPDSVRRVQPD